MHEFNYEAKSKVLDHKDEVISFKCELQENLQKAMKEFVEKRPNLDQYSIIHRAIAGFLIERGFHNREITKLYVGGKYFQRNTEIKL